MAESREPEVEQSAKEEPVTDNSPYLRLPWPAVAVGLFAFIAVALTVGIYANQNLHGTTPQVAPTSPQVQETVEPTLHVTQIAGPTIAPTPVSVIVATATALTFTSATPSAQSTPTTNAIATIPTSLAVEIGDAYQHYWQVRAEALLNLDTAHLSEVMAGDHLASIETLIQELKSEGRAILTDVDHHYAVIQANNESAEVADAYTDASVYVDSGSHQPVSDPASDTLHEQYKLSRVAGIWRVVSLVRGP